MSKINITYLDDINYYKAWASPNKLEEVLHLWDTQDIQIFLNELDKGCTYLVVIEFVLNWQNYYERNPSTVLSRNILIEKDSNSELISNHIYNQLARFCHEYYIDDNILRISTPGIIIHYCEIKID